MKLLHIGLMQFGFSDALKSVCDDYEEIMVADPNCNERILQSRGADVVFIQIQAPGIVQESIEWLKFTGSYVIQWCGDYRIPLPQCYIDYADWGVDLSCFSNMDDVRQMRGLGYKSEFLQIGYDPEIYYPDPNADRPIDIVFMGNDIGHFPLSQTRKDMVKFLKEEYGDRFKAFGQGQPDGNFMGNQAGEAQILRMSKIAINLSHFEGDRYTSDRMFRAIGSKCCVLSHNYTNINQDFKPGVDLWTWDNFDELKQRIDWLLKEDDLRKDTAENGYELVLYNNTFKHMAQNIIKLWQER